MCGGSFVGELCIALEHRWKPEELFVLFTAYFDESDTHGVAPTIIMSAFLGHAKQWEMFGRKLKSLQKEEGFSVFHGKEIDKNDLRKMRLVDRLTELVRDELEEGFSTHLEHERYVSEYKNTFTPKGVSLDSQYGVCFRLLLSQIVNRLSRTGKKHRLHVVLERGHRHALNCERIFHEIKEILIVKGGIRLLGTFTLATKSEAAPLMVADFLAYSYKLMRAPGGIGLGGYPVSEPKKGEAGLTFVGLQPGALANLKLEMQRDKLAARAYKRQRGVSGEAASSSDADRETDPDREES